MKKPSSSFAQDSKCTLRVFILQVAKLVEIARENDAAAGREVAKQLAGKISRKVVKQPVMTVVYGVTFVGGTTADRKTTQRSGRRRQDHV